MATGGAWTSEVFDNGRDFQKGRAPPMQSSETPPDMYNPSPMDMGKEPSVFGLLALCLRIAQILFTVIAFAVMASSKQTLYQAYYSNLNTTYYVTTCKFSYVGPYVGILAVNCIVCAYAVVQLVQSFVNMSAKGSYVSSATKGFAILTFLSDMVLSYTLLAVSAAGAFAATLVDNESCDKFIQKTKASVAVSFLAFAFLAASAALYVIRLLRLTKG